MSACFLKQGNKVFVNLAAENHLDNIHRLAVCVAQTFDKFRLFSGFFEHLRNLRTAAVYQHDLDSYQI